MSNINSTTSNINSTSSLINNQDDTIYFLNILHSMCTNSLQSHHNIPDSDKLIYDIFGIERKSHLQLLKEYIDYVGSVINYCKLNPEHILNRESRICYNKNLSRLQDMIKINHHADKIKCFVLSIKKIPKINFDSVLKTNYFIKLEYFDTEKFNDLMKEKPILIKPLKTQVLSNKTFIDPIMLEKHNCSDNHFIRSTNILNQKCCITKDKYFLENITNVLKNDIHTLDIKQATFNNNHINYDTITAGCVKTKNHTIRLNIKFKISVDNFCIFESNNKELLQFITRNKVSRKNHAVNFNFVKATIKNTPAILLDDKYKYDFDERIEFESFNFYKLVNSKIYKLLCDNANKQGQLSSIFCNDCKIYTTSENTNIKCSQCDESYCRICSKKTHPFAECTQELSIEELEKINETITPCPKCNTPYERTDACVHMQCKGTCNTDFCHLCGNIWDSEIGFHHIWDCLCSEISKYPKIIEYIPILINKSTLINITKPQIKILQKFPKLLQYLIDTQQSIIVIGNTTEKIESLKKDTRFNNHEELNEELNEELIINNHEDIVINNHESKLSLDTTDHISSESHKYINIWNKNIFSIIGSTYEQAINNNEIAKSYHHKIYTNNTNNSHINYHHTISNVRTSNNSHINYRGNNHDNNHRL